MNSRDLFLAIATSIVVTSMYMYGSAAADNLSAEAMSFSRPGLGVPVSQWQGP